jgi:hypothetical protein
MNYLSGLVQILLISPSQVVRTTGVSHRCLAFSVFSKSKALGELGGFVN